MLSFTDWLNEYDQLNELSDRVKTAALPKILDRAKKKREVVAGMEDSGLPWTKHGRQAADKIKGEIDRHIKTATKIALG